MSFYATSFIFDDIPCEFYDLYIGEMSAGGESSTPASADVEILKEKLFRRPAPLFWGAEQTPVLTFSMSVFANNEISAEDFSRISQWLFGQMTYKKLIICQADMDEVYFNCFLTSPQIIRMGNIIRGVSFTVVCDAPWGWKIPKEYSYTFTWPIVGETVELYNESANNAYTFPTSAIVTANIFGGTIIITNTDDSNRQSIFSVSPNEVLTLNCDLQFISSSVASNPIANFNNHWIRLVPGYNHLYITGNIASLSITSERAHKIGG